MAPRERRRRDARPRRMTQTRVCVPLDAAFIEQVRSFGHRGA
ncbi:hypothetical protein BURCENK562V_C4596 [Burkholderia cenocepacia K56-2Valvano]|nr:hypothetical protein BURCENK562V_C4596 [Burkholderia cenocepacia K56-2Valvano]